MQSPGTCPALRGHFYGLSPARSAAQILAGQCEITPAGLNMESKAVPLHCGDDTELKAWHLSPAILGPVGAVFTNDWCIRQTYLRP